MYKFQMSWLTVWKMCTEKGTFRSCFLRPAQANGIGKNDAKVKCTPSAYTYSMVNNWNKYNT